MKTRVAWIEEHLSVPHPKLSFSWGRTQALKFYSKKVGLWLTGQDRQVAVG